MLKMFVFMLTFLVFTPLFANISVTATVDKNKMYLGDTFTYKISVAVSSSESMGMGQPKLPAIINKFDVLNSWVGSESRSTFVNGDYQVKNTKNFNYILAPQKKGKLILGAASVRVNGQLYKTEAISITVLDGKEPSAQQLGQSRNNQQPGARQRRSQQMNPEDDLFSQLLKRHGFSDPFGRGQSARNFEPIDPEEAFFIKVEVDKAEVYVGEQVKATWYLYTRGNVRDIDTLKYPSLNGFWKEDIEVATRLNFTREIINGVAYNKALLASYALFPINPGPNTIDEYEARCGIILPSLGFGKTVKSVKKSQELTIQVNPLPLERPETFNGGVGQFRVTSQLDVKETEAHQPVTLTLRFDGRGNAKLINLPTLPLPEGLELYDKKSEAKFYKNGKSYKEFKVLLIPSQEGEVVIPEFTFSGFDPGTQEFYDMKSGEYTLKVKKGKPSSKIVTSQLGDASKGKEVAPESEYKPQLETSWDQGHEVMAFKDSLWFWAGTYLFIVIFLIYFYLREMGLTQRKKTIQKLIQNKFKKIESLSTDKDKWRDVGAELTNTLYLSLGAVSDQGGAGLEFEKMLEKTPPSVRRELSKELKNKMKECETLSFAPDVIVGEMKNNVKNQVKEVNKLVTKLIDLGMGENVD